MELESVPGVGAKTAARLRELDDPEAALERGDVAAIARAPQVSEGQAARIARGAIRARHDDTDDFLATDRARELYDDALDLLQAETVTDYAAKRLETFYPSASESRLAETREFTDRALARDPTPAVADALADVTPLAEPRDVRVRDRCLATSDAETYSQASDAFPELSVELVDDARDVAELARGYATVIALDESFAGIEVEGDVRVEPQAFDDPVSVVPERALAFFARNRDSVRAAARVHDAAGIDAPLDTDTVEDALSRLTEEGTVADDDELDRLSVAVDDLDAAVSMAENVANDRLREAIEERDVTIEGGDLLSLVERGAGVDSLLDRELADEYSDAIEAARDQLIETLSLSDHAARARTAFPDDPTFPVEHDERVVSKLREELTAERDRRATRLKQELAEQLADLREPAADLVDAALELDVELAVARFADRYDCTVPEIGGSGIAIEGGRSPLLDVAFEDVEPVEYAVGGVALLSGVNSGGKTSTLDLVGLVAVLAHMGMPVPADEVRIEQFETLHYQAKSQGTLDAGAFESTLREFGDLATGDATRLVLVDELESITEPGASALIIAGILEALHESDSTAVFVSHLAGEIRDACAFDVQVDGIEAVGLEDGELRVNRSPVKNKLARSTPELIVEKLAEDSGEMFYDDLLDKFE
ncbi:endonuclease MutS2 [Halosegnis rubeus]|jgi:dsDNA-specific endonuclease/ATPase MutS2|uniref:DNA-binding protein MutS2 n=1 Tax=Halosegnis rubeus TaxID=2212850 RepID=A0A5N5U9H2_9EURY|nr:endonuclease MutS2 [Halosegnis rubeus]KAB7513516.1 endonuclease MutS2 [Halosegnis rubeus]KAB7515187.1 endonuclease MutS2 [Halosegnis rubeus]KAB7516241.1 endonuclease MutS2 [Halosegnis rubeus]